MTSATRQKPLNEIEAGNELIGIISTGDFEYADIYYTKWCMTMRWTPMLATRIRSTCQKNNLNPARFGAQEGSRQVVAPTKYDWSRIGRTADD